MQKIKCLHAISVVALVCLVATSCRKEISEPVIEQQAAALNSVSSSCRPTVMGMYSEGPGPGMFFWKTIMQKWYDPADKLQYIKVDIGREFNPYNGYEIKIPWGVVSYAGNQVYLKKNNDTFLRVTVDNNNRPLASYFTYTDPVHFFRDTIYYYYSGDQITSIFLASNSVPGRLIDFFYDFAGNLVRTEYNPSFSSFSIRLTYDYSQSVNGMLANHIITGFPSDYHLKLIEFMDILKIPIHHKLIQVRGGDPNYTAMFWDFDNQVISSEGFVTAYLETRGSVWHNDQFYIGWDCGTAPANMNLNVNPRAGINSLDDFRKQFPRSKQ